MTARRLTAALLVMVIAVATPPALIVTGFRVVANDWLVRYEYGREGFPRDRHGLTRSERTALALTGLNSIKPGGQGIEALERADLPGGESAFDERELDHMRDVRGLFGAALRSQLVALGLVAALALVLARTAFATVVPRGLVLGALATLGLALVSLPVMALGFDSFFVRFHELFFAGDTWRFASTDTLLRLYPNQFWVDTGRLVAMITVAQALVLAPLAWWWLRRVRRTGRPAA